VRTVLLRTTMSLLRTTNVGSAGPANLLASQQAPPPVAMSLGTDATPCTANTAPRLILVSITDQRVWMCQNKIQVYSTRVTTGAVNVGDSTPVGTWQIQSRETYRYLVGPGYRDFVHYWMPLDGDFGFHDAPWQTMPCGAPGYTDNGSHGCVHLPATAMAWLYDWAPNGTTVTIRA
jgi:lipoprotein-anchoring transpeptidase ErfK/SrfK